VIAASFDIKKGAVFQAPVVGLNAQNFTIDNVLVAKKVCNVENRFPCLDVRVRFDTTKENLVQNSIPVSDLITGCLKPGIWFQP
jgi:hypothetical protein